MDRRQFIRIAAAGGGALASGGACARGNKELPPDAVGLLFDSTLCVGCKACVAACKQENGMPVEISTEDRLWDTPLDISGKTLNVIKAYRHGTAARKDSVENGFAFVKKSCLHCVDASCVSACPVKAMKKDAKTGVVSYDKNACIGCRYCVAACPFGVPRFTYDSPTPQISKCQLCQHRWAEGKYAACAEVCPTGATLYGRVDDLKKEIARRRSLEPGRATNYPRGRLGGPDQSYPGVAAKYVDHVYGEKELGGTQMLMLSGVPFDKLGYPALPEVSYASQSETLQHTLYGGLVAPIAFLGALTWIAKRNVPDETHDAPPASGASSGEGDSHGR
ncbi:MAG: hydrogenase 2 operon protein HybA [Burkholderiales bacterium]|nr:hydrogenase 2 operon protein HybA [Burkholderiales bacterium]MCC7113147.1 hydrogenase 2 operon protein HybA [Burkholderiales bacterium]